MNKKTIIAILLLSIFLFNCGGGSGGSSSPSGEKPGVPEIVQVLPSHYIALTNSAIIIRAKILNGNGGPVRNHPVTFTNLSPIGTLINENDVPVGNKTVVKTNNSGLATIKVKSSTTGFATIMAEVAKGVGIVRDRKTVYFSSTLASQPFMYLDADADSDSTYNEPSDYTLFENNSASDNQVLMRATVFNKFGQRVYGATVQFGSDYPYKSGSSPICSDGTTTCYVTFPNGITATTDSNGQAYILVQVDPVLRNLLTVLNITALADVNGDGYADAGGVYSLYLLPITLNSITVTASPNILAPDDESTISASVKLNTGGPAPDGTAVGFVADCGSVEPFALTTTGLASVKYKAPSSPPASGTCRVTATVDGLSNFVDITISSDLTVIPETQVISGASGGTVSYVISGGVRPYAVTSSNRFAACNSEDADCSDAEDSGTWNISTPDGSGNYIFTATVPQNTPSQTVTFTVMDAVGKTDTATLTINVAALTVQPGTITIDGTAGGNVTFTIYGGVPPYDIFANIADPVFAPTPAQVTSSGNTFTVTVPANTTAKTIIYTVRDANGSTTTGTLTITAAAPPGLLIIPASQSVVAPKTVSFSVSGGTAPYVITSTDPSSACNSTDADCSDPTDTGIWNLASAGSFTVTVPSNAVSGDVTLNVFDSVGATKSATLTVVASGVATITINPASISVTGLAGNADNVTFIISGGTAPYTAFSSNTAIAEIVSVGASSFTVDPKPVAASTAATLTVLDSNGLSKTATITVTPFSSSLGINPSTLAVTSGTNDIGFNIIGGTAPFTVYSSNASVVSLDGGGGTGPLVISTSPYSFTADALATGSATITVVDSDGKQVSSNITVSGTAPDFALTCNPALFIINPGFSGNSTCTVSSLNGFSSAVNLTCSGLPAGVSCGFLPSSVTPPPVSSSSSALTINVGPATSLGSYTFSVVGTSGSLSHVTTIDLVVTIGVVPYTRTVDEGNSTTFTIYGGTGGPYTVTSSNPARAYDSAPGDGTWNVATSGTSFTVNTTDTDSPDNVVLTVTDGVNLTTAVLIINAD